MKWALILSIAGCGASPVADAGAGGDQCAPVAADGEAHLLATYTLPATSILDIDPRLTAADLTTALASGANTTSDPGIGSGVAYLGGCPATFAMVTDSGPSLARSGPGKVVPLPAFTPTVVRVHLGFGTIVLDGVTPLLDEQGRPATGLPNDSNDELAYSSPTASTPIPYHQPGLDVEDVRVLPGGDYLVVEESAPSVAVVDRATGVVKARYVPAGKSLPDAAENVQAILPAILSQRRQNLGFESVALSADGAAAYAVLQAPMGDDSDARYTKSRILRVIRLDVSDALHARVTGDFLVRDSGVDDYPGGNKQKDVKVSSATWLAADRLLLLERASGEVKLLAVSLPPAANVLGKPDENSLTYEDVGTDLGALGITPAAGALAFSTLDLPAIGTDKLEGVDIIDADTVVLSNDNDFGVDDASVPSQLWIVRTAAALR